MPRCPAQRSEGFAPKKKSARLIPNLRTSNSTVNLFPNKLEIYELLDRLGDAADQGDRKTAKACREKLMSANPGYLPDSARKAVQDAVDISWKWVRGVDTSVRTTIRALVERAISRAPFCREARAEPPRPHTGLLA